MTLAQRRYQGPKAFAAEELHANADRAGRQLEVHGATELIHFRRQACRVQSSQGVVKGEDLVGQEDEMEVVESHGCRALGCLMSSLLFGHWVELGLWAATLMKRTSWIPAFAGGTSMGSKNEVRFTSSDTLLRCWTTTLPARHAFRGRRGVARDAPNRKVRVSSA